jgi:hypothetical protein
MTRLEGRLKKLEAQLTDRTGLVPHSPKWLAYWTEQLAKIFAGQEITERIPLEAVDAILAASQPEAVLEEAS